tara:strand:- start:42 stop:446 length:405 start_codon:yes stop_codon:yes gene_type:complete
MKTFNQFIIEAGKLIPGGPYSSKPRKPQVGDKATDPEALKAIELERQIGKTGTLPTKVKPVYKQPVQQPKTEQPKTEKPAPQPKAQPKSSSTVQRTTSTNTQRRTVGEISPNQIKPYKYDREASKKAFDNLAGG